MRTKKYKTSSVTVIRLKIGAIILLATIIWMVLSSCDNDDESNDPLVGGWVYNNNPEFVSFELKPTEGGSYSVSKIRYNDEVWTMGNLADDGKEPGTITGERIDAIGITGNGKSMTFHGCNYANNKILIDSISYWVGGQSYRSYNKELSRK